MWLESPSIKGAQDQTRVSCFSIKPENRRCVGCALLITFLVLGIIATLAVTATVLNRSDIVTSVFVGIALLFVCLGPVCVSYRPPPERVRDD